jgi:hypothetical protein
MEDMKNLIRIANRIQESLMRIRNSRYIELLNQLTCLTDNLSDITKQSRRLRISVEHGWLSAAKECCEAVNRFGDDVSHYLSCFKQLSDKPAQEILKLSTLIEDLKQLQQEFGKMDFDKEDNTLSVITEPITLEDVYLGPFEIKLELNKIADLYKSAPYCCIALDPHPAATSEDVTHPHVTGDRLCEGDGYTAIRAALEQGRICDFFTIIRGILNTYSPDSPYVQLSDWEGVPCYDCGCITDEDNSYYCGFCDNSFCEQCSTYCPHCEETLCLGCAGKCELCEDQICPNCVGKCSECGASCCQSCLEEGICQNCKEELEVKNEQPRNQTTSSNRNEQGNKDLKLAS